MLRYQKKAPVSASIAVEDTFNILNAAAATGSGTAVDVRDYRYVLLQVGCSATTTLTIKVQGSASNAAPDFNAAQTVANHWDYIGTYDLNSPASVIVGDTGVSFSSTSAADGARHLYINTDLMKWVNVSVTAYTAGSVTVNAIAAND